MNQMSLFADRKPVDSSPLVGWLVGKGWRTRKDIVRALAMTERDIRDMVEHSDGRILSGQSGYRLTCEATLEEIEHCTAMLRSQVRRMNEHVLCIERRKHGRAA